RVHGLVVVFMHQEATLANLFFMGQNGPAICIAKQDNEGAGNVFSANFRHRELAGTHCVTGSSAGTGRQAPL
ncbi:MAG TPA: hypothetical protein VJ816_01205, partial [Gemmatimonadales bacterium]|nr:hypothetical protein [Gemmatimonadales bacterium]